MRAHTKAVRVALLPLFLFAAAAVSACGGSDEGAAELVGVSEPIEVTLESITVDDPLYAILDRALQDEYRALATYGAANLAYGDLRPFSRIVEAEDRHVTAVSHLLEKRGVDAPEWDSATYPVPEDFTLLEFADACQVGLEAEQNNVAMYEGFLALTLPADVASVFSTLKSVSEINHSGAFDRCN